jgi:hypothetical protein
MLSNIERIFTRAKQNPMIGRAATLNDYRGQTIARTFALAAGVGQSMTGQPVEFPGGAIVLSVCMAASEAGKLAADRRGGLDMIRVAMDLPSSDGTLISGSGGVRASALFGVLGERQWPEKEFVMARQGSINVTVTNLTLSALDIDILFNVLLPRA